MKLKDLTKENLPREKASIYGIGSLSDTEILALILESGIKGKNVIELSNEVLNLCGGITGLIYENYSSLENIKGLNKASIFKLLAINELYLRLGFVDPSTKFFDTNSLGRRYYKKLLNQNKEYVYIIHLGKNQKIQKEEIFRIGSFEKVSFSQEEILDSLVLSNSKSFVLLHNHPFGTSKPSKEDLESTFLIKEIFENKGFSLIDHLIISQDGFFSFKNNGLFRRKRKSIK